MCVYAASRQVKFDGDAGIKISKKRPAAGASTSELAVYSIVDKGAILDLSLEGACGVVQMHFYRSISRFNT